MLMAQQLSYIFLMLPRGPLLKELNNGSLSVKEPVRFPLRYWSATKQIFCSSKLKEVKVAWPPRRPIWLQIRSPKLRPSTWRESMVWNTLKHAPSVRQASYKCLTIFLIHFQRLFQIHQIQNNFQGKMWYLARECSMMLSLSCLLLNFYLIMIEIDF